MFRFAQVICFVLVSIAAFAQQTKVNPSRLVRPSTTANAVFVTDGSGAAGWTGSAAWLASLNAITGTGSAGQVAYFTGGGGTVGGESNLFWDATNDKLGVGVAPSYRAHIKSYGNSWESGSGALGVVNSDNLNMLAITNDCRISIGPRTDNASVLSIKVPPGLPDWWLPLHISSNIGNLNVYANQITSSSASFSFGSNVMGGVFGFESPDDNSMFWIKDYRIGFGGSSYGATAPTFKYHFFGVPENDVFFSLNPQMGVDDVAFQIEGANTVLSSVFATRFRFSAGNGLYSLYENQDATSTSAHTEFMLKTGSGGGDPRIGFNVAGGGLFFFGIDNADNDILKLVANSGDISGTGIINYTSGGDIGISTAAPTARLDVNGSTRLRAALHDGTNSAGSNGNVLISTGSATQWTPSGGDVTGAYSNLQLNTNSVGQPELAANSVLSADIVDGEVATADLANGAVTGLKIGALGATVTGQVPKWNNSTGQYEAGYLRPRDTVFLQIPVLAWNTAWPTAGGIQSEGYPMRVPDVFAGATIIAVTYSTGVAGAGSGVSQGVSVSRLTTGGSSLSFGTVTFNPSDVRKEITTSFSVAAGDLYRANLASGTFTSGNEPKGLSIILTIVR